MCYVVCLFAPCSFSLAKSSSRRVSYHWWRPPCPESDRIHGLVDQQPALWDGCRTIDYYTNYGASRRLVILCGDREGDDFMAYIEMAKWADGEALICLYTSEERQPGCSGPPASPQTVAIARNKMGDAIKALPDINEAINTGTHE